MRYLFCLYDAPWPIRGGQQLHTYNMIAALTSLGHEVHLTTYGEIGGFPAHKHRGWSVSRLVEDGNCIARENADALCRRIAVRWMRYWGTPVWVLSSLEKVVQELRPEVAILVGLQALPLAAAVSKVPALWYAADDWVLHYLTLAKSGSLHDRIHSVQKAILSLCYERSLSFLTGGAIAVSRRDQEALKWAGGFKRVSLIPNGVDTEFFNPRPERESEKPSICFWGRMDFEPNIEAMIWFCSQVWPVLLNDFPDAVLTIVGANPTTAVKDLGTIRNVIVTGEVEDIRPFAWCSQVVVMPIRIGAGIKNKLLEACAMGKSIVTSQTAVSGLETKDESSAPWIIARKRNDWVNAIERLWTNPEVRLRLGYSARDYVGRHHSWREAANRLAGFINKIKCGS